MQIPVIKDICSNYSIEQLKEAEEALLNEESLSITIEGQDEGEQLTHIMAAVWVLEEMEKENIPLNKAIRNYTVKVRNSIS